VGGGSTGSSQAPLLPPCSLQGSLGDLESGFLQDEPYPGAYNDRGHLGVTQRVMVT
jgi:hypothetical protein